MAELSEEERSRKLAALREELRGYEQQGKEERARQVEREIARLGGDTPAERAERRPAPRTERRVKDEPAPK